MNNLRLGLEVVINFTLKGESSLWVFLRNTLELNEYTAVIKISKEDKSQKMFISMGTYIVDKKDNLIYKEFVRQQLTSKSCTLFVKISKKLL